MTKWLGLVLVAGLAGCGRSGASTQAAVVVGTSSGGQTVRLATNPVSPSNGFVWVGMKAGVLASPGLNVDLQGLGGSQRASALISGQIDAEAGGGPQELVAANAHGSKLTIVATFSRKFDDVLLVPNEITSVEQLKGKKIGAVTTTSVDAQGWCSFCANTAWNRAGTTASSVWAPRPARQGRPRRWPPGRSTVRCCRRISRAE